ncbi:unnamed protein product [Citrullus colocynthis]|uniref:Uncharacterized protein n=1 Tax=Citrullus colocynthis TaxID=252529 RepID=A0ABP0Z4N1_9ROSI
MSGKRKELPDEISHLKEKERGNPLKRHHASPSRPAQPSGKARALGLDPPLSFSAFFFFLFLFFLFLFSTSQFTYFFFDFNFTSLPLPPRLQFPESLTHSGSICEWL